MLFLEKRVRRRNRRQDECHKSDRFDAPTEKLAMEVDRLARRLGLANVRIGVHLVSVHGLADARAVMGRVVGRAGMLFELTRGRFGALFIGVTPKFGDRFYVVGRLLKELGAAAKAAPGRTLYADVRSRLWWSHEIIDPPSMIALLGHDPAIQVQPEREGA